MGRPRNSKAKRQWMKEQRQKAKDHDYRLNDKGNWIAVEERMPCRVKQETYDLMWEAARDKQITVKELLNRIATRRLHLYAHIHRFCDRTTRPFIRKRGDFKAATRRRRRPASDGQLKLINPLLMRSAKKAVQYAAEATGMGIGMVVDWWIKEYVDAANSRDP